jgi:hypothetical protein
MITLRHPRTSKTATVTEKMAHYLTARGWRRASEKPFRIDDTGLVSDHEGNVVLDVNAVLADIQAADDAERAVEAAECATDAFNDAEAPEVPDSGPTWPHP